MNNNFKKAKEDLIDSNIFLGDAIEFFKEGKESYHKLIAIQLFALLCGKRSLFRRIFPNIRMHPIIKNPLRDTLEEMGLMDNVELLTTGGSMRYKGGILKSYDFFDFNVSKEKMLDLSSWLKQIIITINKRDISIEDVVVGVRHKSAAHFDPDFKADIKLAQKVLFGKGESHKELLLVIGEYINFLINEMRRHKII